MGVHNEGAFHSTQVSISLYNHNCFLVCSCVFTLTAHAYTLSGSQWSNSRQSVVIRESVNGNYLTAINQAVNNINNSTDVTFSTSPSGLSWTALVANYGNTGWEGQSQWSYSIFGKTSNATSKINSYYIPPNTTIGRMRVLWLHELSHVWGLGHSGINTVMYTSASAASDNGVRYLTSDDINGINSLY